MSDNLTQTDTEAILQSEKEVKRQVKAAADWIRNLVKTTDTGLYAELSEVIGSIAERHDIKGDELYEMQKRLLLAAHLIKKDNEYTDQISSLVKSIKAHKNLDQLELIGRVKKTIRDFAKEISASQH